eukprot:1943220-Heterocapsa_arctica.AAC.1
MVATTAARYADDTDVLRASRWAWLMPALLLRRPRPTPGASGARQEWTAPDAARTVDADFSLTQ